MTISGVERDLKVTPLTTVIEYGDRLVCYCFSSYTVQQKFEKELETHRAQIKESLTNRFRISFNVSDDFCDLDLYRRTERRGFLVRFGEDEVTWLGQVEYNGQRVIKKN